MTHYFDNELTALAHGLCQRSGGDPAFTKAYLAYLLELEIFCEGLGEDGKPTFKITAKGRDLTPEGYDALALRFAQGYQG